MPAISLAFSRSRFSRFSLLAALLLLSAMLTTGAAFPVARAQQTQPAAAAQPQHATQTADEDPSDVYRHSATVRWIARSFHTSTESAARTFEAINFVILALAILIPLARILPGVLRRRSLALRQQFDSTRQATEQANAQLAALKAQLGDLGSEIEAIRRQVAAEMESDEARHRSAVQEETARILASAGQEIDNAAAQAQRELRSFAANLAMEKAIAGLTVSAEQDRVLLNDFVQADFARAGSAPEARSTGNGGGN